MSLRRHDNYNALFLDFLRPPPSTSTTNADKKVYDGTQEGQSLSFSISLPAGSSNEVDYAEIRLRKSCLPSDFLHDNQICNSQDIFATVQIYQRINTINGPTRIFITGRSLVLNDGIRWEEFVITDAVQQCISYKTELNLELEITLNSNPYYRISVDPYKFFQNANADLKNTTQLVVFAVNEKDVENDRRRKRQLTKEFCFANFTTNCCVRNLTINFHEDLNWTWIIDPIEYTPNYCSGDCPYLWPTANLFASTIQTLKLLNPAASPEPCCVPAQLSTLTIVRLDENGVFVFDALTEMIVDSCICR